MNPFYVSIPVLASFEGEQGGQPAGAPPNPDQQPPAGEKKFTQEDLNDFLAKDRYKHKAQLQKMESQLHDLAQSKSLTEQERETLKENLDAISSQLLTKDQQLQKEKRALEEAHSKTLSAREADVKRWESLYKESTIDRALQDAAIKHEAFNPAQIITQLRGMTRVEERRDTNGKPTGTYKPIVDFPLRNENGDTSITPLSPEAAVRKMKTEMADVYGNLFKGNVVSGVGGNSDASIGINGKVDPRKLSMQQYVEIRENHPEMLGLRPKKGYGHR
jgi:hypothetical protein